MGAKPSLHTSPCKMVEDEGVLTLISWFVQLTENSINDKGLPVFSGSPDQYSSKKNFKTTNNLTEHFLQASSLQPNSCTSKFYQDLLKEKSNPRLKGNRKGIIVKGKEFYTPILNTFPTR